MAKPEPAPWYPQQSGGAWYAYHRGGEPRVECRDRAHAIDAAGWLNAVWPWFDRRKRGPSVRREAS